MYDFLQNEVEDAWNHVTYSLYITESLPCPNIYGVKDQGGNKTSTGLSSYTISWGVLLIRSSYAVGFKGG